MLPHPSATDHCKQEKGIKLSRPVNPEDRCRCGHKYDEHHPAFGCMHWSQSRMGGWCKCDGFRT